MRLVSFSALAIAAGPAGAFVTFCPHATLTASFDAAGFDVRWEVSGFKKGSALMVGRRRG